MPLRSQQSAVQAQSTPGGGELSDRPTADDRLEFCQLAHLIADRVAGLTEQDTPLVIGVYGPWGSGKTSFLKIVESRLNDSGIEPVWFNAWKYSREENLWAALLQRILDRASSSVKLSRRLRIKIHIWWDTLNIRGGLGANLVAAVPTLLRLVAAGALVIYAFAWQNPDGIESAVQALPIPLPERFVRVMVGVLGFAVAKPGDLWKLVDTRFGLDFDRLRHKWSFQDRIAFLDVFAKEFERIIHLARNGRPLVVIIDDLDRCLPEQVVAVLEAIKQFLDVPGCVFLLALDNEIVENAISVKYKELLQPNDVGSSNVAPTGAMGTHYIEKIVQLPIQIPRLTEEQIVGFVQELLPDDEARMCAPVFAAASMPNPRRVKRLLRVFDFLRVHSQPRIEAGEIRPSLLAKLVVIQHEFPRLFSEIVDRPELLEILEYASRSAIDLPEPGNGIDPVQWQRVRAHVDRHPRLQRVLSLSLDEEDTFVGAEVRTYLFVVPPVPRVVAEVPQGDPQLVAENLPTAQWREYVSRFLQRFGNLTIAEPTGGELRYVPMGEGYIAPRLRRVEGSARVANASSDAERSTTITQMIRATSRAVVVGQPGSGKTALLSFIGAGFARAWLAPDAGTLQREMGAAELQIPVLVSLREVRSFVNEPNALFAAVHFAFTRLVDKITELEIQQEFEAGRLLLLFDGMDELPMLERTQIAEGISDLVNHFPACRCIVTTRPSGARPAGPILPGFKTYEILPWDQDQLDQFLSAWTQLAGYPDESAARLASFIAESKQLSTVAPLLSTPLGAFQIALIGAQSRTVPQSRAEMLHAVISMMFDRWDAGKGLRATREMREAARSFLRTAAIELLETGKGGFRTIELREHLRLAFERSGVEASEDDIEALIHLVTERVGVFGELSPGQYGFAHRVFRDYFAAEGLSLDSELPTIVLQHAGEPTWYEPLSLALVLINERLAESAVSRLLESSDPNVVLLAAEAVTERQMPPRFLQRVLASLDQHISSKKVSLEHRERAEILRDRVRSEVIPGA